MKKIEFEKIKKSGLYKILQKKPALVQNLQNSQKTFPKMNKRVYMIIQDHRVLSTAR